MAGNGTSGVSGEEQAAHGGSSVREGAQKWQAQADLVTRLWTDLVGRMSLAGLSFTPNAAPPEAARQVRSAMFEAMSHYLDEFMRSPQFLEGMKQSLDAALLMRKQFNDYLTRIHHEMQGTAREDIDSLMLTVRHVETRLLDRIDELASRLEELGRRLDSLQAPAEPTATAGEPRARSTRPSKPRGHHE